VTVDGFGLIIGFIEHLQIRTGSKCSAIRNSHTLQFTTACTKSSQTAVSSLISSAFVLTFTTNFLLFWLPSQYSTQLSSHDLVITATPNCIASAQTAQKTLFPTVLLLLFHMASRGYCSECVENTIPLFCVADYCLAMAIILFVTWSLPISGVYVSCYICKYV
jgi:hypothetical protein